MVRCRSKYHFRRSVPVFIRCLRLEGALESDIRRSRSVAGAAEMTERKQSVLIDDECGWAEVGGVDVLSVELVQDRNHLGKDYDGLLSCEPAIFLDLLGQCTNEGALQ